MSNHKNNNGPVTKAIMNPTEAAEYLGVSRDWILRQYNKGLIPGKRLGHRLVRFHKDELDEFIKTKPSKETPIIN